MALKSEHVFTADQVREALSIYDELVHIFIEMNTYYAIEYVPLAKVEELKVTVPVDPKHIGSATETELGSRQNRINLLSDTHERNEEANNDIARNLVGLDEIQTQAMILEMQAHQNALISTFKMYNQVNNLSLFNLL